MVLKHLLVSRIGRQHLHLLKLAGSLLILIALLLVVGTVAWMSDSWDALKNFQQCSSTDTLVCAEVLYRITGVSVWAGQSNVDVTQTLRILIGPTVLLFVWLVLFVIGLLVYRVGNEWAASAWPAEMHHKKK